MYRPEIGPWPWIAFAAILSLSVVSAAISFSVDEEDRIGARQDGLVMLRQIARRCDDTPIGVWVVAAMLPLVIGWLAEIASLINLLRHGVTPPAPPPPRQKEYSPRDTSQSK